MFIFSVFWIIFCNKKGAFFRSDKNNCRFIEFNRFRIWIIFPLLSRNNEFIITFKRVMKWVLLLPVIEVFKGKFRKSVITNIAVNYIVILLIFTKSINEFTPIRHCIIYLRILLWTCYFELDALYIVFSSIRLELRKCPLVVEIDDFTRLRILKGNGVVQRHSIFEVGFNLIQ